MTLEIKKQRETPLLSRNRVTCMVEYSGATPSRLEFRKRVAGQLKAPEDLIIIKHIYTRFGQNKAKIIAHIYKDKKDMAAIEEPYLMKKHEKAAEKGSEQASEPEAPKAEKPAEEPKPEEKKPSEELKTEEKKE